MKLRLRTAGTGALYRLDVDPGTWKTLLTEVRQAVGLADDAPVVLSLNKKASGWAPRGFHVATRLTQGSTSPTCHNLSLLGPGAFPPSIDFAQPCAPYLASAFQPLHTQQRRSRRR